MWVGFGMILVGVIGCGILGGWKAAFSLTGTIPYANIADYTMACIPLFIFMGCALLHTGFGSDLYSCARAWLCRVRGGLAMATSVACGLFAAVCGDSVATAVTMGKISYPEMIKYRYSDKMSAACIAAGGTVGVMIPPSIPFILYGLLTENSIGKLFIAGIVPGILQVLSYCIVVFVWCHVNPNVAPDRPDRFTYKSKLTATKTLAVVLEFVL
jgi:tripartite ATP-independent transporter DctM subunit